MLAAAARLLDNPLLLEWHNAAAVFYDPVNAHIGLVLLTHQLGYFDILPLYVVLMAMAPVYRRSSTATRRTGCCPSRLRIYLLALVFQLVAADLADRTANGSSIRSPGNSTFVLGFLMARERGIGGWVRTNIGWLRLGRDADRRLRRCAVAWFDWWPDPTTMPEPKLLFMLSQDLCHAAAHDSVPGADRADLGGLPLLSSGAAGPLAGFLSRSGPQLALRFLCRIVVELVVPIPEICL